MKENFFNKINGLNPGFIIIDDLKDDNKKNKILEAVCSDRKCRFNKKPILILEHSEKDWDLCPACKKDLIIKKR